MNFREIPLTHRDGSTESAYIRADNGVVHSEEEIRKFVKSGYCVTIRFEDGAEKVLS